MLKAFVVFMALAWAGAAAAADQPRYAPAPAWVKPQQIPASPAGGEAVAVKMLLQDIQTSFGQESDQFYSETAVKALTSQGLSEIGNISMVWRPDTETLTIHKLHIIRGAQVIDLLAGGKTFTVLRRETNLELAMLDGALTATFQPEGLQAGDILDLAVTLDRKDPVMQGRSEGLAVLASSGVLGHAHFRSVWPDAKPIHWRATDGLGTPILVKAAGQDELLVDLNNVEAPKPPAGAPARFASLGRLELSQFTDWAEVSSLMAPLYAKAATLAPNSPVGLEIEKIKAASQDPKQRAAAALRLVEEQTRYLFLGMNLGGYVPADVDVTWTRRFGDCKGKTALLLAILQRLGIEAEPALVNTTSGDGLDERLPMLNVFDHVMVRAVIGGKVYWLDGTRQGDRDLDKLQPPGFGWVLLVQPKGGHLEKIEQPPLAEPDAEILTRLDASGGLDAPAPAHVDGVFRGDAAIGLHLGLARLNQPDIDRFLREYWRKLYPWIDAKHVDTTYDEARATLHISLDGAATMDWANNGSVRDFNITESSLGQSVSFKREPGPHQDAPYAVRHPTYQKASVTITLPGNSGDYSLAGGSDVDASIAGVAYRRVSRIENGVATMEVSQRSLAPEFPASEADKAASELRDLARTDVAIRISASAPPVQQAPPPLAPVDAAGFSRRGVSFLRARDFDRAVADFTRAAELDPGNPKHLYNRGAARYQQDRLELARADFDQVLKMKPDDKLALMARADIYLKQGDEPRARQDFDQAIRLAPDDVNTLRRRAEDYARFNLFEAAFEDYDQIIARFPVDDRTPEVRSGRCLSAAWIKDLNRASAACEAALAVQPGQGDLLQSRGVIRLRLGRFDDSIADFDQALRLAPDSAIALYGRGVAKRRKGLSVEAKSDTSRAASIDPKAAALFAAAGVNP